METHSSVTPRPPSPGLGEKSSVGWSSPGHIPEYRPSPPHTTSPSGHYSGAFSPPKSATQDRSQSEPAISMKHIMKTWTNDTVYSNDDITMGIQNPLSPSAASYSSSSFSFSRLPDIPETGTLHSVSALATEDGVFVPAERCPVTGEVAMEVFVACLNEGIGVLDVRPLSDVHQSTNFLLGYGPDRTRTRRMSAEESAGDSGSGSSGGRAMIWRISKYLHMNCEDLLQRLYELPATSEPLMIVVNSEQLPQVYKDLCIQRRYERVIFINDTCFIRHCLALCQRSLRASLAFESTLKPRIHEYTPLFNANIILEQCFTLISERIALWNHSENETTVLSKINDLKTDEPRKEGELMKKKMIRKRADCLDIGCGTGRDAVWMALQNFEINDGRSSPVALDWNVYCVDKNDKVLKTLNNFRTMSKTVDQIEIQKVKIRKDGCMVVCPPFSKIITATAKKSSQQQPYLLPPTVSSVMKGNDKNNNNDDSTDIHMSDELLSKPVSIMRALSKLDVQWDMKARRFAYEPVPFQTPFDYGRKFDLIQSVRFLDRKVLAEFVPYQLKNSGFVLVYTFMVGAEKFGKPKKAEYLLKPGELIQLFCGDYFVDEVTRLGIKTWKCPDTGYYFKFQLIHNDETVRLPDGRPMQGFVARKVVL